ALQRTARLMRDAASLDDLELDPELRQKFQTLCDTAAQAQKAGKFAELPWIMAWGQKGSGKATLAAKMAAYANRSVLAFNPMTANRAPIDDLPRPAQRGPLLRGAVLYVGDIGPELLPDQGHELGKRLVDYPSLMVLGIAAMQPPRFRLDKPL